MQFETRISAPTLANLDVDIRQRINEVFDSATLDLLDQLQRESPEGATGELKAGWDIVESRRRPNSFEVGITIANSAPGSEFRIAGRGPGKFPPIAPIQAWVETRLSVGSVKEARSVAFLIARGIARKGTKRWRDRSNWVGIDNRGKPYPGGAIDQCRKRILAELKDITAPRRKRR